jgi:hypothetical protein
VFPQSLFVEELAPNMMVFGGDVFGSCSNLDEAMRDETLMMRSMFLQKPPGCSLSLCYVRTQQKGGHL